MEAISRTEIPFTIEEEIIHCQKFTSIYQAHQQDSASAREAACLEVQYPACMCPPQPGDSLVGRSYQTFITFSPQAFSALGYCFNQNRVKAWKEDGRLSDWEKSRLAELEAFWECENTNQYIKSNYSPLIRQWLPYEDINRDRAVAHGLYRLNGTHMDFGKLLRLGVDGLHLLILEKQAYADEESMEFYKGLHSVLNTFTNICKYYVKEIETLLAKETTDEEWKKELIEMRDTVARIAHAPASGFRDAIQLTYLWWVYAGSANFGRMDTYFGEYYVHDIDNGILTERKAQDLLLALWRMMVLKDQVFDCRVFLGGKGRKNEEICDRFALLAINTTREFHNVVPQLSLRAYEGMNPKVYEAALAAIGEGCTFPILYNDDVNIPAVSRAFGVSEEIAETYCPFGCGEYVFEHASVGTPSGVINLAKALEVTLFHGRDAETGERLGIDVGGLETYRTFEELFDAYKKQVEHFVCILAKMEEAEYVYSSHKCAFLTLSMLFDDCISRGKPLLSGGVRYLGGTLESYGNVNAADSLTAIKQVVYDEKKISADVLLDALRKSFKGMPNVRRELLACPKYGNEDEAADSMLVAVHEHVCNTTRDSAKNTIMHSYLIVVINNSANTALGGLTSATPDGRMSGVYLANANNPQGGADKNGLTAMLNSIVKPPVHFHAGCVQNLKLAKEMFSEKMLDKTEALLDTYFKKGGAQLMITVVSKDEMEDAIVHPEKHQDLLVRVGGFSARFVELDRDIQQELLSRTLHGGM